MFPRRRPQKPPGLSDLELGPQIAPARLTKEQAVRLAKDAHFSETLFAHPYKVKYGSHTSRLVIGNRPVGTIDVWMINITGLFLPRPGGSSAAPAASRPVPATTLIIHIDDKAGNYLEANAY